MTSPETFRYGGAQLRIEETRNAAIKIEAVRLENETVAFAGINNPLRNRLICGSVVAEREGFEPTPPKGSKGKRRGK